jgi:hypothetical protein
VILRRIVDFIRSLTPLQATGNALAVQFKSASIIPGKIT